VETGKLFQFPEYGDTTSELIREQLDWESSLLWTWTHEDRWASLASLETWLEQRNSADISVAEKHPFSQEEWEKFQKMFPDLPVFDENS
jgi:hypothetical protein